MLYCFLRDRMSWWTGCGGPRKIQNNPVALARIAGWMAGPFLEGLAGEEQVLGMMRSSGLAV